MTEVLLTGAVLLDAGGSRRGWLRTREGLIAEIGTGVPPAPGDAEIVAADGGIVVPGLVDLHVHGGGGAAFEDAAPDALAGAIAAHRAGGTGHLLVSLVSAPIAVLEASLRRVGAAMPEHREIAGVHLEGPFLSRERAGAHDLDDLTVPTPEVVARLLDAGAGVLRSVTIAPELPGALEAIATFADAGVTVGIGHTEADYDTARAAIDAGARLVTHAFNAMPALGHRAPGPLAAAIEDDRVVLELILDGLHVHPSLARLLFAAASDRVALVTDAMAAAAAPDGDYRLGALDVTVAAGRATLRGTDTLAGSTLTTAAALANAVAAGIPPVAAVAALTTVPARVLGIGRERVTLAPGAPADLVLLDPEYRVLRVLASGF